MQKATAVHRIAEISRLIARMSGAELAEMDGMLTRDLPVWVPLPGPQTEAFDSPADILYYGGSAGGGKSDLVLGLALTRHANSIIYRRQATQLIALQNRLLGEILRSREGWNGQQDILTLPGRRVEFGSCNTPGDEIKYQGRPHDYVAYDEITHFTESQFRFLCGWNRTTVPGQRCRIVCAGNPPTNSEGQWVVKYWGPWLDPKHPNPARPGELRWYTTLGGEDVECPDATPFEREGKLVRPLSRTFIPSRVTDNPFLMATGYEATLQALPEPLRSQMLNGDFRAGMEDSAWQVIPTAWVEAAMERWRPEGSRDRRGRAIPMTSAGVDVARGGNDKTVIATRYDNWYAPLVRHPGSACPDGATTAGLVVAAVRDGAPVHVDALGVGGETVGHLQANNILTVAIVGNDTKGVEGERDRATGRLKFRNLRAMLHWRFRESLDPVNGEHIALPPDPQLKADLCAPLWKLTPGGILIEDKEEIRRRIGRSPDDGDAVIYCSVCTARQSDYAVDRHGYVPPVGDTRRDYLRGETRRMGS